MGSQSFDVLGGCLRAVETSAWTWGLWKMAANGVVSVFLEGHAGHLFRGLFKGFFVGGMWWLIWG